MKKIIIATDSFKECMTGLEVASEIESGFKKVYPNCEFIKLAMADGGEGTVESLVLSTNGQIKNINVCNPLNVKIDSFYGVNGSNDTAFIEMAAASGLHHLTEDEKNPLLTSTFGTGELIIDALDQGIKNFIIGLGGSATNDGGIGMASALGVNFYNKNGEKLLPIGQSLNDIATICDDNLDPRIKDCTFTVAVDVTNPFYGETGASYVFGPQKGATPEMVATLDAGMKNLSNCFIEKYQVDVQEIPGSGAAGGLGGALVVFTAAKLQSGVSIVTDFLNLKDKLVGADLLITGEGRMDSQSINGKAPIGAAKIAKECNVPVIAICGSVASDVEIVYDYGVDAVYSVMLRPSTLSDALSEAKTNINITSHAIARTLNIK